MSKRILIALSVLMVMLVSPVWAEFSKEAVTGKASSDLSVYVIAYNNADMPITSNSIVILDIYGNVLSNGNATSSSTNLGSYVTGTTLTADPFVLGVADEDIASGTSGRICVRGPHIVRFTTAGVPTATGQVVTTTSTRWQAAIATHPASGTILGFTMGSASTTSPTNWWVYLRAR